MNNGDDYYYYSKLVTSSYHIEISPFSGVLKRNVEEAWTEHTFYASFQNHYKWMQLRFHNLHYLYYPIFCISSKMLKWQAAFLS